MLKIKDFLKNISSKVKTFGWGNIYIVVSAKY